jgi:hypothetical protein
MRPGLMEILPCTPRFHTPLALAREEPVVEGSAGTAAGCAGAGDTCRPVAAMGR